MVVLTLLKEVSFDWKKNLDSMMGWGGKVKSRRMLGKQKIKFELLSSVPPEHQESGFVYFIQTYQRKIINLMTAFHYLQWQSSFLFIQITHNFVL